jgi:alanyl-tRNA synthetase
MTSLEIRRAFLDFFAARSHRVVPSSPLVLPHDPTLLFANAGMNQFKDVFTGREKRDYVRAATSQKCLRVSGKHNDLEEVGRTPRHQTFFEMLGNFSFGDYFKNDAIAWSWELLTKVYGIPQERLWVTVFDGTPAVPGDDEALAIWRDRIGVPPDRILRLGEKENFWRMGDTGPCGPCSEIHFDLGDDLTSVEGRSTPENDSRRYVEIWNLVFMQFDQAADGTFVPLPAPSIDTGMGLERLTSVLQGKRSNYDTDLFSPILQAVAKRAGTRYGAGEESDTSMRVIADHTRALCFLVADGVVPANDKRGYVLRRVLRRAIRHGRKLGLTGPFLGEVAPVVIETLGEVYPEIVGASPPFSRSRSVRRSASGTPWRPV